MKYKNIVILSGAGISQESGINTFRGADGLWENHRIEEVAHPRAFLNNPELVHRFYNQRRAQLLDKSIKPNAAHLSLKELEDACLAHFLLVTQNVDNLFERAGFEKVVHIHGELLKVLCRTCQKSFYCEENISTESVCKFCGEVGDLRPDIVWFEEPVKHLDEIFAHLKLCDLFICIGTSNQVYPAASFVDMVPLDCRKIEVNLERTVLSDKYDENYFGLASIEVPKLVKSLIG